MANSFLASFGRFLYDHKTHKIVGRTCTSWAQIALFFLAFFLVLAIIFAIHLAIFIAVTPGPTQGRPPWNFGKYAYSNYPNRKIDLILTPKKFLFNLESGVATLTDYNYNYMSRLEAGANASGVSSHCNRNMQFGFPLGQPCIYLHIAKVFDWTAGLINSTLYQEDYLPFNCTFSSSDTTLSLSLISQPSLLPLNISNNANSRSFPFNNQDNYRSPVVGLILNLTALPSDLPRKFDGKIRCLLDFDLLGMQRPSDSELRRAHEIPSEATTTIKFQS